MILQAKARVQRMKKAFSDMILRQGKPASAKTARNRNRVQETRNTVVKQWGVEVADYLFQSPNISGYMGIVIQRAADSYPQQYDTARRMVNNAIIRRLLDPLQASKTANTRHALPRDWKAIRKDAYSDTEVPIEDLKQLGLHIGVFGTLQEGPPVLGLEDVSAGDDQALGGTGQGDGAPTAGVTEESSGMAGISLTANKSYGLGGPAGVEQDVGESSDVTQKSSGPLGLEQRDGASAGVTQGTPGPSGTEQEGVAPTGGVTQGSSAGKVITPKPKPVRKQKTLADEQSNSSSSSPLRALPLDSKAEQSPTSHQPALKKAKIGTIMVVIPPSVWGPCPSRPGCSHPMSEAWVNELRGTSCLTVQEGLYLYATIKFNNMMLCMHHIKTFCLNMGMVDAPVPELYRHLQGLWRNRDARDLETYLESPGVANCFVRETVVLFAQSARTMGKGKALEEDETNGVAGDAAL